MDTEETLNKFLHSAFNAFIYGKAITIINPAEIYGHGILPDVYVCPINPDHKWLVPGDCPFCENIDLKIKLNELKQDLHQALQVIVVMRERIAELSSEENKVGG